MNAPPVTRAGQLSLVSSAVISQYAVVSTRISNRTRASAVCLMCAISN